MFFFFILLEKVVKLCPVVPEGDVHSVVGMGSRRHDFLYETISNIKNLIWEGWRNCALTTLDL